MRHNKTLPGLRRHHHKWKGRHWIPAVVQPVFRKTCFVYVSKTTDQEVAYREYRDCVKEWDQQIDEAKRALVDQLVVETLQKKYAFQDALKRLTEKSGCAQLYDVVNYLIAKHEIPADALIQAQGNVEQALAAAPKPAEAVAEARQMTSTTEGKTPFLAHWEAFETHAKKVGMRGLAKVKSRVHALDKFIREHKGMVLTLEDMQDKRGYQYAQWWVTHLIGEQLASSSIKVMCQDCNVYWRWIGDQGMVEKPDRGTGPFARLNYKGGKPSKKVPPYPADKIAKIIEALLEEAAKPESKERMSSRAEGSRRDVLIEVAISILIAAFTGMREESLAHMLVTHIRTQDGIRFIYVPLTQSKTEAGRRGIPINPVIEPLIDHLIKHAKHGRMFHYAGSQGSRWRSALNSILDKLGIERVDEEEGTKLSPYHSLRHNFNVALGQMSNVKQWVQEWLMGHRITSITHGEGPGQYGGAPPMQMRYDAIKQLSYPGLTPSVVEAMLLQMGCSTAAAKPARQRSVRDRSMRA